MNHSKPILSPRPGAGIALATTLTFCACSAMQSGSAADSSQAAAAITPELLESHVRFLSSDHLEGRGVGTRGDELARSYLATQMAGLGLQPGGPDGSWEQRVPIRGITSKVTQPMAARGNGDSATFEAPTDFTAVAGSPDATASWNGAELVFVGYGIHAPEQSWDDYQGMDLTGKVLLFMNNDPSNDPEKFAGKTRLYYGRWSYKFEEAARRGAIGAIVIHTTPSAGYPFQVIQASHGRENFWLPFADGVPTLGVRSWCSEGAAKRLCELGGHDLDALRERAEKGNQPPVPLGVAMDLAIENTVRELESANVLGVLPGSDNKLKDEYVVITAHFDHLGIGKPRRNDEIYNGAVDNATGCAGMLAIAQAAAELEPAPRRSLLFLAVTAEESGLLGSKYYAQNPTVDKKKLLANFNVDGLNIWGKTRDVEFIGHGKSSLTALAEAIAAEQGRRMEPDSSPDKGLFYRSDHFSFARIGVPAAFFKAGRDFYDRPADRRRMKASYTTVNYHQPSDELADWWRFDGAVPDVQLLFECLVRTANADTAPTWTPGDEFEKLR
ncbi:MAG: M20/M25/M40 family metallo-hydrolase [bacterium]|nr:M20/M25/M40 family metallo-hydrolase [bacterium]